MTYVGAQRNAQTTTVSPIIIKCWKLQSFHSSKFGAQKVLLTRYINAIFIYLRKTWWIVHIKHAACYRACLAVYSRNKNIEVLAPLNIPSNSNRSSRISNKLFGFDSLHFHCVLSMCLCMSCPYIVWVYRAHVCLHRKKRESTSYTHTASPKTFCPFFMSNISTTKSCTFPSMCMWMLSVH